MKNRTAYGFVLLLLVQALSATLYAIPTDEAKNELQASHFEIKPSSNNSSSPCGNNLNFSYVYAFAPFSVIENQSFSTTSYVYCEILNANMMLDYSIIDSNNSTVYSGNQSWTGSNTSSSSYTWNVSGLSAGYYTFNADLYVDGALIDTDYDSFMVYANTSGGGGSGGGNYTSPCGSNVNYSYVYAYAPYMLIENQSFSTTSYVYCEILNTNMMLDYSIVDSSNSTVYSGNQSWTGSNASGSNFTWNVSGLSAGYYTFNADLYVDGTLVDSDYDSFMVYANTSGGGGSGGGGNYTSPCGSNVNYTSMSAYAPYIVMENQSFTTSVYVNCEIFNATIVLDYSIVDSSNSTVYSGNQSWTGSNTSSSSYTWNVSGLSAGFYTFNAELYVDGTSVDSDYDSFMVYPNSSGGGGSGGGNYTSPCGSNANYSYVYAFAPFSVIENQSFTTTSYVYCEILNANMTLDYSIVDSNNSTVYSGNQSWIGTNSSGTNYTWNVLSLSSGYYIFNAGLYVDGTLVDSDSDSFMVYANTSGGGGSGNNTSANDAHCLTIDNISMSSTYILAFDLVNICSIQINYPGVNASANHAGVSGLPNTSSWWYYAIGPNGSYNVSIQLYFDENVSNNTVVDLVINPTILNCGGVYSWHDCPDSSSNYTFTYVILSNNSGGNTTNDTDGDGVPDSLDAFPMDANETSDNDGDGVGDNADTDDDNDGVSDQEDAFPFDSGASNDTDADGIADAYDNCIAVSNPSQADADMDGIGTECDADESNGNSGNNTDDNNADGNTDGNNTGGDNTDDNNADGNYTDGNNTTGENNTAGNNTDDNNTDGNNTDGNNTTGGNNTGGNVTLLDTDGDGIDDSTDNCQFVANPDQADTDGNGVGTACDVDEILNSDEANSIPSIGMLATSLCLIGVAVLVRRD